MAPLLPQGASIAVAPEANPPGIDRAELIVADGIRWVKLIGGDGRVVQERPLPASIDCAEAARSAAVLLAAWQFQGRGVLPPPLVAASASASPPPRPALGPGGVAVAAAEAPGRGSAPDRALALSRAAPSPSDDSASRASQRSALAIGAGASLGASGDSRPIGATAELFFGRMNGPGLRAQLGASTGYSVPIGPGHATWNRVGAGLGAMFQGRRGAWGAGAHADVLAARLGISGDDKVPMHRNGSQLLLGVGGGVRGLRTWGPAQVWLDATVTWWPGQHDVVLSANPDLSRPLPGLEIAMGLGMSFFVWP
jgi:hypothetical protein